MGRFNIGDRVIFLNEKGGGIVTGIVSDDIVHVSVADGFEIPYAVKDLLKAGVAEAYMASSSEEEDANPDMKSLYAIPNKIDQLAAGVYLAFVPEDQQQTLKGSLEVLLINHNPYQLLYSIYQHTAGHHRGVDFGYVDPDAQLRVSTIERTDIEAWANGMVQLVFYMEGKATPLNPASETIRLKPVKVYKEDSFRYEPVIRKHALFIELTTIEKQAQKLGLDQIADDDMARLKGQLQEEKTQKPPPRKEQSFLDKHKVDDKIAEVDLHIGELIDRTEGLSNVEMLNIQMDYFRRCMEEARAQKLSKVIFIHGVGNGRLKNELSRFLRQAQGVEFYDASFARYGMGATEVVFYKHGS